MERYICQWNIERFRDMLASVTDAEQRRTILQLLAEELARECECEPPQPADRTAR